MSNRRRKNTAPSKTVARAATATPRAQAERSAGGIVVRVPDDGSGPLILLIRDSYENWGFPKGHVEKGERPDAAALREVGEETGLVGLTIRGRIDTINWWFRLHGQLIHKFCVFYLMELGPGLSPQTDPQRAEGITDCAWVTFDEAQRRVAYANARQLLDRAYAMITEAAA